MDFADGREHIDGVLTDGGAQGDGEAGAKGEDRGLGVAKVDVDARLLPLLANRGRGLGVGGVRWSSSARGGTSASLNEPVLEYDEGEGDAYGSDNWEENGDEGVDGEVAPRSCSLKTGAG